ncbi:MAG: ATP-binding cassette domain-containing protein [Pseudomonadota bacterium]
MRSCFWRARVMAVRNNAHLFFLKKLCFSYLYRPVMRALDWEWRRGEHWAVLGPNGAGKSSLAAVLSGEQKHYAGTYTRSDELEGSGIAYVCFETGRRLCERDRKLDCAEFEGSASDTGTRVRDLLAQDDELSTLRARIIELLNLEPILERGLRHVSTGEMRKTLLASALLKKPGLLILDSPLDGLDLETQRRFGHALNRIISDSPAVLVLSRSVDEVPQACSRLLLLGEGRIRDRGDREAILNSAHTATLLAAPEVCFKAPEGHAPTEPGTAVAPEAGEPVNENSGPTLELRDVSASFGGLCVFRELNWRLDAHQHCLIAGPNGSGKSTLLDLLTGDNHKAYGQEVYLFGRRRGSGESVWDIKSRFGRVDARMQFAVPQGSSVADVVLSGHFDSIGLHDRPTDRQRDRARNWLRALDLGAFASTEFHTLSFGLQRLVLLARAMVKAPRILLLDEATLSLDAGHRRLLLDAIDHVIASSSCQLLFVSHTAGEVPDCINQQLSFEPDPGGSRVRVATPD